MRIWLSHKAACNDPRSGQKGEGVRLTIVAAAVCLAMAGVSRAASDGLNEVRKQTAIEPQGLGAALQELAKEHGFQIGYVSEDVSTYQTGGLSGNFTSAEALANLLGGTNLTYRYLTAENAVSIVRTSDLRRIAVGTPAGAPIVAQAQAEAGEGGGSAAPASPADAEIELQEVQVTGSRIARSGMSSPTPVMQMSSDDLENLSAGTVMDALDQLPQFLNSATTESAGVGNWAGSVGQSFVNLRGIGAVRTLVLVNNRRFVSSTREGTTDINLIPQNMIKNVDVVTGGASAAYGSDAVSGVVNFILDTEFTGLKGGISGGITSRGDNGNVGFNLAAGTRLGERGHLVVSGEYYRAEEITTYEGRDWYQGWGVINNPAGTPARVVAPWVRSRLSTQGGLIVSGPMRGTQFSEGGVPVAFQDGQYVTANTQSGGSGQQTSYYDTLMPFLERKNFFGHVKFDLTDNVEWFAQGIYGESNTSWGIGGVITEAGWPGPITIWRDNAFLPDEIATRMDTLGITSFGMAIRRHPDEFGYLRVSPVNRTTAFTTGFDAEAGGWNYKTYYQYGQNKQRLHQSHFLRADRFYKAVDSVVDPATGRTTCRSTLSFPTDGCIPLDLFGPFSSSVEAREWTVPEDGQTQIQDLKQHFAEVSASGPLFDNWAGPVSLAVGASYRKDSLDQFGVFGDPPQLSAEAFTPVPTTVGYRLESLPLAFRTGTYGIFQAGSMPTVRGSFNVKEVFGEMLVPLARDLPFAPMMDFSLAGRYADYSGSGGVFAWKTGIDWQMHTDVRFRGTFSHDTRAGTLSEQFDTRPGTASLQDPFLPGSPTYVTRVVQGGDPAVEPEESDTLTFGLVYRPSWLAGFAMSADYYDIQIDGAISLLGQQRIVDQCFAGAQNLCDRITRFTSGESAGTIQEIANTYMNVSEVRTRGLDTEVTYTRPISLFADGGETLSLRGVASYLFESSYVDPGAPRVDIAGQTGLATAAPRMTGIFSVNYAIGGFSAYLQEQYIASGKYDARWTSGVEIDDNRVPKRMYTNAKLSYTFGEKGETDYDVYVNVSNVFDKAPPRVGSLGLFSRLGRSYTAGLRVSF